MAGKGVASSVKGAVHNLFGYKPATKEEQTEFVNENRQSILIRGKNKFKNVTLDDFQIQAVIGRGTFGKVFLAEFSRNGTQYAIKSIRKDILIEYDQVENTLREKDILFECKHPFLIQMDFLFQNEMRLYFVMPFIQGGELYKILKNEKKFKEDTVIFYAIQLIMAIDYLHNKNIIHRDLKLENIMIDLEGYIKIIDYGLAKKLDETEEDEATTYCGTPEYLAPEMVSRSGHDKSVDWWAIGVLMYEMLFGMTPFYNQNQRKLLKKIKTAKVLFPDKTKFKIEYSDEIMDLIIRLLDKDRATRLGTNGGAKEILSHPLFKSMDHNKILNKTMEPPFKPDVNKSGPLKYFNVNNDVQDSIIPSHHVQMVKQQDDQFKNFDKVYSDNLN